MDWDAVLKRENKKAIEAKKYGELLKQQTDEDKERFIFLPFFFFFFFFFFGVS